MSVSILASFARRAWALTRPYFNSEEKWKARTMLAGIVALNLAAVYMLVLLNEWNRAFYDALQNKDAPVFWRELGRFLVLAFSFIVIAVYRFWLTQLLELRWRTWLTQHYNERWLHQGTFYRIELARQGGTNKTDKADGSPPAAADNPDQRISEDLKLFTSYSITLSMGLLNAVVTLLSFIGILWGLSGGFSFTLGGSTYEIAGFMVWMAVLYAVAGSVVTHLIGRPLVGLNFRQQRVEADFRHHLMRIREYSESIALDRGETVERGLAQQRFAAVVGNFFRLITQQKRLTWFTVSFGQLAVVFPFVVAAPRFFAGAIQLGELMQIASAFGRVQDALAWLVDNYDSLASWKATTDRLLSFEDSMQRAEPVTRETAGVPGLLGLAGLAGSTGFPGFPGLRIDGDAPALEAQELTLGLPAMNGAAAVPLLAGAALRVAPGETVLVSGPSGCGKSTLFRAVAGIWPYARGRVQRAANTMFLPQKPYLPHGRLRDALAYPEPADHYSDEALRAALIEAALPQLADRLDEEDAWNLRLSPGEQQRLAIARVFLKQPRWLFADEASSALDEATEALLYRKLRDGVLQRGGGLVSIAHRPGPATFHARQLRFEPADAMREAQYRLVSTEALGAAAMPPPQGAPILGSSSPLT